MHRAICSPEPNKLDLGHFGLRPQTVGCLDPPSLLRCWLFSLLVLALDTLQTGNTVVHSWLTSAHVKKRFMSIRVKCLLYRRVSAPINYNDDYIRYLQLTGL